MSAAFFDTNILAYAADTDSDDPAKRDTSRQLMQSRMITVSTQIMMEFYSVLRKKLAYEAESAMDWMQSLQQEVVISLTPVDVIEGIQLSRRYEISHWDGLVLRAAARADLEIIYTEDLSHGQSYGPVRVCNPFIEDFLA